MPLRIMSNRELAARQKPAAAKSKPELSAYAKFIKKMKSGQIAHINVVEEKVTRQAVKLRIAKAAQEVNVAIKFHRSGADEVMFSRA